MTIREKFGWFDFKRFKDSGFGSPFVILQDHDGNWGLLIRTEDGIFYSPTFKLEEPTNGVDPRPKGV